MIAPEFLLILKFPPKQISLSAFKEYGKKFEKRILLLSTSAKCALFPKACHIVPSGHTEVIFPVVLNTPIASCCAKTGTDKNKEQSKEGQFIICYSITVSRLVIVISADVITTI